MKNYFIITACFVLMSSHSFSQDSFSHETKAVITKVSEQTYQFEHTIEYVPELEQRLIDYSNRDRLLITDLSIAGGVCIFSFGEDVTQEEKEETFLFLVNGMSFKRYDLEE